MTDVLIIGGGIFGQTIAARARKNGAKVRVLDTGHANAASPASACLMKPSWLDRIPKATRAIALKELDDLFGVQTIEFRTGKTLEAVQWVPAAKILAGPTERATVLRVVPGAVELEDGRKLRADRVIVSAGVWSNAFAALGVQVRAGWAHRFRGTVEPFIRPWAPYKQLVAFNEAPGSVWVGDGSALKANSATAEREAASVLRCSEAVQEAPGRATTTLGFRPYLPNLGEAPCLLRQLQPNVWVATGGAKIGTLAAGWAAYELDRLGVLR